MHHSICIAMYYDECRRRVIFLAFLCWYHFLLHDCTCTYVHINFHCTHAGYFAHSPNNSLRCDIIVLLLCAWSADTVDELWNKALYHSLLQSCTVNHGPQLAAFLLNHMTHRVSHMTPYIGHVGCSSSVVYRSV